MGQVPSKYPQQLDAFGYHHFVVPHNCPSCGAGGLECNGNCLKAATFPEYNNPYVAGARNKRKRSRRTQIGSRKTSPTGSRQGHSRSCSISSIPSTASITKSVQDDPLNGSPSPSSRELVTVPKSVSIPIEEQALCYFLANWVLLPRQGRTGGYMEYIIPLYSSCKPGSHLHHALSAASLAAFGNRPNCRQQLSSRSVAAKASLIYAKALESTNRALRDPLLVKEDETLAAVLMLGFFETLTTYRCQTAWGSHNEGAIALVKLRGADNLKTRAGQILFAAVRTQTLIRCLTVQKQYDKSVDWTSPHTFRDSGAHGITELNILLIELRSDATTLLTARSRQHDPAHTSKVLSLLNRAKAAKAAFINWTQTRSDLWIFGPTAVIEKLPEGTNLMESEVFPGRVDVYHELWIASIWNMGRTTALLVSSVIVRCAAWLAPKGTDFHALPEYREASRFDRKIVEDMIASVPFLLGWHKRQSRKDFLVHPDLQSQGARATSGLPNPAPSYLPDMKHSLSGFACGDDGPGANAEQGKALGGYFSMWPMFVAASSDFSSEAESRWIHGRLRFISDHMGIHQANFFASAKVRIPSMAIRRDQMELANMSPPPSTYLEKAFLKGQDATAVMATPSEAPNPNSNHQSSSAGMGSGLSSGSPTTCSTGGSPEHMYIKREARSPVASH